MLRPLGTLSEWSLHHHRWKKQPYYALFERAHLANASAIHVTSDAEADDVAKLGYGDRTRVIPLGVEIEEDTSIVGTPEHVIGALTRLQEETGGFGGFLVMAHEWANREKTLRSYELLARYVVPHFKGWLDPLRSSYDTVVANKRSYGGPAMAAIAKAFEDAGKPFPDDLTGANLR